MTNETESQREAEENGRIVTIRKAEEELLQTVEPTIGQLEKALPSLKEIGSWDKVSDRLVEIYRPFNNALNTLAQIAKKDGWFNVRPSTYIQLDDATSRLVNPLKREEIDYSVSVRPSVMCINLGNHRPRKTPLIDATYEVYRSYAPFLVEPKSGSKYLRNEEELWTWAFVYGTDKSHTFAFYHRGTGKEEIDLVFNERAIYGGDTWMFKNLARTVGLAQNLENRGLSFKPIYLDGEHRISQEEFISSIGNTYEGIKKEFESTTNAVNWLKGQKVEGKDE